MKRMRNVKIVATLGPASSDYDMIRGLFEAGADVFRLNMSHGTHEDIRSRHEIIRKVEGPSWAPTPEMKQRNPEWPDFVPPGPDNPLGTHALWLSWQYYRIHGTHDTRKIGRKSSNGCIGLYNEHIQQLYDLTKVGTQVLLI